MFHDSANNDEGISIPCNEKRDLDLANSEVEVSSFISPSSFMVIDLEDSESEVSDIRILLSKVYYHHNQT